MQPGNFAVFPKVHATSPIKYGSREFEAEKIAAQKASKAKDDFLAALSHELRTPLTPALAAATYLQDQAEKLPPEFAEDIEIIKRNVQLQARLIDDLLDLTRIARGMLHLELEDCDAHKIIENALEMAKSALAAKQLKVSTGLEANRYHILADCIRLQQVFWNLINNAVKFTPQSGQITLRTFNDKDGRFHFEIADTGIGIEPQRLASLFQPFEQADPSVSRQFGGLGLGLAISKRLIDLHHGKIEAESRGRSFGATFSVTLDTLPHGAEAIGVNHRVGSNTSKPLPHTARGRSQRHPAHIVASTDSFWS
jgi:signal transduction histidine kinase